jgi:acylphosphatase
MKSVEITVSGLVQGVGFRYFIYQKAKSLGLSGYVKNLIDGSVYIKAEGNDSEINELIDLAAQGPSRASVNHKKVIFTELSGSFNNFSIEN